MADEFQQALDELAEGAAKQAASAEPASAPEVEDAEHPSVAALGERFGDAVLRHDIVAGDEHIVYIVPDRNTDILGWLRDEPSERYTFLQDLTAVDYGGGRPLQVVYQLYSLEHKRELRIKAELPLDELEIDSVVPLWQAANWLERETYDMFGIHFGGHPDLRRILMPESYEEGHPLRKDFPMRGRFSRAEQTRRALELDLEDYYLPRELELASRDVAALGAGTKELPGTATEGLGEFIREHSDQPGAGGEAGERGEEE